MSNATTRDEILDAAERLFEEHGFAGTTIKQIAAAGGVNSALLYYYFTDKQTLYRAVLQRLVGGLVSEGLARLDVALPPDEAVRRFVRFQAEFMSGHPRLPRLLARELVDHEAAHAEAQISQLAAGMFERLCGIIRRGQADGVFRAELDPRFAAISTVAQVVYMLVARPAVGILLGHGRAGAPPEVVAAFAVHAADFAVAALRAPPDGAAPRQPSTRSPSPPDGGADAPPDHRAHDGAARRPPRRVPPRA